MPTTKEVREQTKKLLAASDKVVTAVSYKPAEEVIQQKKQRVITSIASSGQQLVSPTGRAQTFERITDVILT